MLYVTAKDIIRHSYAALEHLFLCPIDSLAKSSFIEPVGLSSSDQRPASVGFFFYFFSYLFMLRGTGVQGVGCLIIGPEFSCVVICNMGYGAERVRTVASPPSPKSKSTTPTKCALRPTPPRAPYTPVPGWCVSIFIFRVFSCFFVFFLFALLENEKLTKSGGRTRESKTHRRDTPVSGAR